MSYQHTTVLLNEAVEQLITRPDGVYIDATCGLGGHSEEIAKHLHKNAKLIAFDLDPLALEFAKKRLDFFNNVHFIQNNFAKIKMELISRNIESFDGILYDLGVSSLEIDSAERGFSFMQDGPLDMRMGQTDLSAADVINTYSQDELTRIFREYGEERFSGRIARVIVETRPYYRTLPLVNCIKTVVHGKYVTKTLARIFQALRIEVNQELESIKKSISDAIDMLNPGGRIVVISFHSLEDRIVKNLFHEASIDCVCPPEIPVCVCNHKAVAKKITRKPIIPSEDEIKNNSRSRSAKCRVLEKL
ncbi:MAG: 16S rRNA (cytosine(1402)-N(4))-methyltransferase RsmH [Candidatus Neomarinimicrobiota bacterium]